MRKTFICLLVAVATFGLASGGNYQELPAILDGSMSLYDFGAVEPSAIPDSLQPRCISYIARHGARFLTSEDKITAVEQALHEAEMKGALTRKGRKCLALMDSVRRHTAGRWGLLSPEGIAQEWRLGREMALMYPEIFREKEVSIKSVSSYVTRVIETMDNFTCAVAREYPGLSTSARSGHEFDELTRFFVTDSAYNAWREDGCWKEVYHDFTQRFLPKSPAESLVTGAAGFSDKKLRKLSYNLYKVLQGLRAMGLPAPTTEWMSRNDYRRCWEATNLEKYFRYSLSPLSTQPAKGARKVAETLINQASGLLKVEFEGGVNAIFGHAETLLPIYALLGVQGATALPLDYDTLAMHWSDAELTPLGANLEIIYSQSESGRWYAAMRLNGHNISPVNDPTRLNVPLPELLDYWHNRLSQLLNIQI